MKESIFIHMDAMQNNSLDLKRFQREFRKKYRGLEIRPASDLRQYCLEWSLRNERYRFSGMMDRRRVTFVIDCFESQNRERDLAEQLLWLRGWFPADVPVIFCDDAGCKVHPFCAETDVEALLPLL